MKASAFRRWPVAGAYSPEQTTRLTGGSDLHTLSINGYYPNMETSIFTIATLQL